MESKFKVDSSENKFAEIMEAGFDDGEDENTMRSKSLNIKKIINL